MSGAKVHPLASLEAHLHSGFWATAMPKIPSITIYINRYATINTAGDCKLYCDFQVDMIITCWTCRAKLHVTFPALHDLFCAGKNKWHLTPLVERSGTRMLTMKQHELILVHRHRQGNWWDLMTSRTCSIPPHMFASDYGKTWSWTWGLSLMCRCHPINMYFEWSPLLSERFQKHGRGCLKHCHS